MGIVGKHQKPIPILAARRGLWCLEPVTEAITMALPKLIEYVTMFIHFAPAGLGGLICSLAMTGLCFLLCSDATYEVGDVLADLWGHILEWRHWRRIDWRGLIVLGWNAVTAMVGIVIGAVPLVVAILTGCWLQGAD